MGIRICNLNVFDWSHDCHMMILKSGGGGANQSCLLGRFHFNIH